jgi:hypothetical protein
MLNNTYLISYLSSIQNSWILNAFCAPLYVGTKRLGNCAIGVIGLGVPRRDTTYNIKKNRMN